MRNGRNTDLKLLIVILVLVILFLVIGRFWHSP